MMNVTDAARRQCVATSVMSPWLKDPSVILQALSEFVKDLTRF